MHSYASQPDEIAWQSHLINVSWQDPKWPGCAAACGAGCPCSAPSSAPNASNGQRRAAAARRQREGSVLEARSRTRRGCWPCFTRRTLSFLAPPAAAHPALLPGGWQWHQMAAVAFGSQQLPAKRRVSVPAAGYRKPATLRPPCSGARSASCILPLWAARTSLRRAAMRWSCSVCQNDTQTPTIQGKRENPCLRLGFWRSTHLAKLPWRWRRWDLAEDFQDRL